MYLSDFALLLLQIQGDCEIQDSILFLLLASSLGNAYGEIFFSSVIGAGFLGNFEIKFPIAPKVKEVSRAVN